MKSHRIVFALLSIVLVACTAPQAPAVPAQQSPSADTAAATEAPVGKRAPGDETPPMQIFRAFGTEPFWNVNVEDSTLTYTTPEDQAGQVMQGSRRAIAGGIEITGSHDGKTFALAVTAGTCNDGMSDNQYELVSTFRYGDIDYKGCGEVAK